MGSLQVIMEGSVARGTRKQEMVEMCRQALLWIE
jgi:hypothetical protein